MQSSALIAGWYKEFQEGMQEYADERVDLRELVRKLSNQQKASSSQAGLVPDSEVENLYLLMVAKDEELLKSKQKHSDLEVANAQLQEFLDATNQRNQELVEHGKEVDANVHQATAEHFRIVEELH